VPGRTGNEQQKKPTLVHRPHYLAEEPTREPGDRD
jgi:hypothetical protein